MSASIPAIANDSEASSKYRLPASTRVGRVRLAVSNLERSIAFYRDVIGLAVLKREGAFAQLGGQGDANILLELEQQPDVQPIAERSRLGLYHTAFLLPTRGDLSRFVQHLLKLKVPFGAGDHWVSEAMYLTDPDGLEVEVYADRPRSQWPGGGLPLKMGTQAVRFDELLAVSPDPAVRWQGAPAGTTVGHVHLYIGDLQRATNFYVEGLGLDVVVKIPSALFTSAGGYHHHVGVNAWAAGSPPASDRDARLLFWELALPNAVEIDRVAASLVSAGYAESISSHGARSFTDPWGIHVAFVLQ
jgi:catechol 2,3-dioxygenase